jgi:hypothetical protein
MLGLEDLDLSNTELMFHLSSMVRLCGSLETPECTARAMSRLECGYVIEKFKPFTRTSSSECVRTCLERLRISFLVFEAKADKTVLLFIKQG